MRLRHGQPSACEQPHVRLVPGTHTPPGTGLLAQGPFLKVARVTLNFAFEFVFPVRPRASCFLPTSKVETWLCLKLPHAPVSVSLLSIPLSPGLLHSPGCKDPALDAGPSLVHIPVGGAALKPLGGGLWVWVQSPQ